MKDRALVRTDEESTMVKLSSILYTSIFGGRFLLTGLRSNWRQEYSLR